MNKSESIVNLAKALLAFQTNVASIGRDSENPFFKKKYASLSNIQDEIKGPMNAAGLCYLQFPEGEESLTTMILHAETGEYMESTYNIHASKKDPQGMGSAITYARRYALCAALGLNVEDDDGNAGTSAKRNEPQQSQQQSQQPTPNPFQKSYNTPQEVKDMLDKANTIDVMLALFSANKNIIESTPALKAEFTNKKTRLDAESK